MSGARGISGAGREDSNKLEPVLEGRQVGQRPRSLTVMGMKAERIGNRRRGPRRRRRGPLCGGEEKGWNEEEDDDD